MASERCRCCRCGLEREREVEAEREARSEDGAADEGEADADAERMRREESRSGVIALLLEMWGWKGRKGVWRRQRLSFAYQEVTRMFDGCRRADDSKAFKGACGRPKRANAPPDPVRESRAS